MHELLKVTNPTVVQVSAVSLYLIHLPTQHAGYSGHCLAYLGDRGTIVRFRQALAVPAFVLRTLNPVLFILPPFLHMLLMVAADSDFMLLSYLV